MGLFSKKSDADDGASISSKKSSMFRRNKTEEPNPYAVAAPPTAYQQARAGLASGPSPGSPAPPPYQSPASSVSGSAYGSEKVGSQAGYNRYGGDNGSAYGSNSSAYGANSQASGRAGGYGGLGDTDDGKDNLFGGAQKRYVPPPQNGSANGSSSSQYGQPSSTGSYGGVNDPNKSALLGAAPDRYAQNRYGQPGEPGADDGQYGGYGEARELTEEEKEKLELQNTQQQIRAERGATKDTLSRIDQALDQIEDTGASTLARMGAQNDRMHNTEKNLDRAANHSKVAEDRTKELKKLNGSMFNPHLGNVFVSSKRAAQRDADILERHRMERDQRQATRADAFADNQRMEQTFSEIDKTKSTGYSKPSRVSDKFTFVDEDDPDGEEARADQADEEEIDGKIDHLAVRMRRVNMMAHAQSDATEQSIKIIDRIAAKTDAVDDHVRMNREKLGRIR